jgi:hypothetical protein
MSTCPHIARGPGTQRHARAANDDAPAASAAAESCVQDATAGAVVAFSVGRKSARAEPHAGRRRDPRQRDDNRTNDNLPYDDLLGMVGAEMARPSP